MILDRVGFKSKPKPLLTVAQRKEHLLWALNKYISLTKQYPLSKKNTLKVAFNLKSQQDELPNLILHPIHLI